MACGRLILFDITFMSPEKGQELVSGLCTPLWFTDHMLGCDFCKSTAVHAIVQFYIWRMLASFEPLSTLYSIYHHLSLPFICTALWYCPYTVKDCWVFKLSLFDPDAKSTFYPMWLKSSPESMTILVEIQIISLLVTQVSIRTSQARDYLNAGTKSVPYKNPHKRNMKVLCIHALYESAKSVGTCVYIPVFQLQLR